MKLVICGSMKFSKEMVDLKNRLGVLGFSEVTLPHNTEKYANKEISPETNHESAQNKINSDLIRGYYNEIAVADAVLIANYDKGQIENYIGGNSFLEAGFAHVLSKKLYFLNPVPEMIYSDELIAMQPIILNNDLSLIV